MKERWEAVDISAYLKLVRAFIKDGEFEAFFAGQALYWSRVEASLNKSAQTFPVASWFHEFFGDDQIEHILVLGLLLDHGSGFDPSVDLTSGRKEAYMVVDFEKKDDSGLPQADEGLLMLVVHEAAHSYVNPRTRSSAKILQPGGQALISHKIVATKMEQQAYGRGWETMVNESLVRAVTRLFLSDIDAKESLNVARQHDKKKGFHWLGDLVSLLREQRLEAGSDWQYSNVLPKIAKILFAWSNDEQAINYMSYFCGPINNVFQPGLKFVAPKPHVSPKLTHYVESLGKRFSIYVSNYSEINIDDGQTSYAVFGSLQSNPVLSQRFTDLGWVLKKEQIVMDEREW